VVSQGVSRPRPRARRAPRPRSARKSSACRRLRRPLANAAASPPRRPRWSWTTHGLSRGSSTSLSQGMSACRSARRACASVIGMISCSSACLFHWRDGRLGGWGPRGSTPLSLARGDDRRSRFRRRSCRSGIGGCSHGQGSRATKPSHHLRASGIGSRHRGESWIRAVSGNQVCRGAGRRLPPRAAGGCPEGHADPRHPPCARPRLEPPESAGAQGGERCARGDARVARVPGGALLAAGEPHSPHRGGGRQPGALGGRAGLSGTAGEGAEPDDGTARKGVRRSVPRARPGDALGDPPRDRLRAPQPPQPRRAAGGASGERGGRSLLVRAGVRRVERLRPCGRRGHDGRDGPAARLAAAGGVEAARADLAGRGTGGAGVGSRANATATFLTQGPLPRSGPADEFESSPCEDSNWAV